MRTPLVFPLIVSMLVPAACVRQTTPEPPTAASADLGPNGVLLLSQAQFETDRQGNPIPGPARLELVRSIDGQWVRDVLEDSMSNVFHKALFVALGDDTTLFTIGGDDAALTQWTPGRVPSNPRRIWHPSFGGRHNRVRDVEFGDVDGDSLPELVMATHDQGVVAVADYAADGWQITRIDSAPGTFVHEVEIGDLDGDGQNEFYATPSKPNRSSGTSQPGAVVQYRWDGQQYVRTVVDSFPDTHAKEILVADLDGDGDELYVVKEAVMSDGSSTPAVPVTIVRYVWDSSGWVSHEVSTIPDRQCRFLVVSDLDNNGARELVAAGFKSGLWWIRPSPTIPWPRELIDGSSSGFEHACAVADMNGDGIEELYVASDDQRELRRYVRRGDVFEHTALMPLVGDVITWGLTAARF